MNEEQKQIAAEYGADYGPIRGLGQHLFAIGDRRARLEDSVLEAMTANTFRAFMNGLAAPIKPTLKSRSAIESIMNHQGLVRSPITGRYKGG
jgi:hypothetical protein